MIIYAVGDIHGRADLLHKLQAKVKNHAVENPGPKKIVFLGDYVDRGKFCIEVLSLILMLKINYPDRIYLLRGNHEGRTMTSYFNFRTECINEGN